MYRWKAARLAEREGLGRVLDVLGLRPSWVPVVVFWSPVIVVSPVLLARLLPGHGFEWPGLACAVLVSGLSWAFVQSDRLALGERGALLSPLAPLTKPFRIRRTEVAPATVAFVAPLAGGPPGTRGEISSPGMSEGCLTMSRSHPTERTEPECFPGPPPRR